MLLNYEDDRFMATTSARPSLPVMGVAYGAMARIFSDVLIGPGYRLNRLTSPDEMGEDYEKAPIGRLAVKFQYHMSPNALFKQETSTEASLSGSGKTVTTSVTSVQADLVGAFALKVSYKLTNITHQPPNIKRHRYRDLIHPAVFILIPGCGGWVRSRLL